MAEKTREELEVAADEIRDETAEGANTAERVGGFCRNLVDSVALASEGIEPSGAAGGDLTGTYPDPTLGNGVVDLVHLSSEVLDAIAEAGAPDDAEYLVGSSSSGLSGERVVTDTTTIAWDLATGGQAKANVPDGSLARTKLANAAGLSVIGRVSNSAGQVQDVPANTNDRILARTSDVLGFFQITRNMIQSGELITAHYELDSVTNAVLRNSGACSVIGRAANSSGDPADISAAANDRVFCRTGDTLQFVQVTGAMIATNTVALSNLAQVGTDSLLGRDTAGTGSVESIGLGASIEMSGSQILQRAALTGDVTAPADSNSTTIANDAVTNAKLANMAAGTVKGRAPGAGTGDPTDRTDASVVDGGLGLIRLGPTKVGNTATVIGSIPLTTVTAGLSADGTAIVEFDVYAAAIVAGNGTYSFYQKAVFAVHYQTDPSYTLTALNVELVYSSGYFDDGSSNGRLVEITVDQDSGNLRLLGDGYFALGSGDADGVTAYAVAKVTPVQPALPP